MSPHFTSPPPTHPPTLDSEPFSRPRPRPPRSASQQALVRIQNRRREYLARNPSYFDSSEHELADPLLYDTLIRRHQTPTEREAEGRARGYARVLEGSLLRGEERLARLAGEEARPVRPGGLLAGGVDGVGTGTSGAGSGDGGGASAGVVSPLRGVDEAVPPAETKTEGHAQWMEFLRERFVRGGDEDFEYGAVDKDEELDVVERVEREEAWFDEETPEWDLGEGAEEEGGGDGSGDVDMDGEGEEARAARKERELQGETGVQDF